MPRAVTPAAVCRILARWNYARTLPRKGATTTSGALPLSQPPIRGCWSLAPCQAWRRLRRSATTPTPATHSGPSPRRSWASIPPWTTPTACKPCKPPASPCGTSCKPANAPAAWTPTSATTRSSPTISPPS
ncbi:hypothetical protein G6F35_017056 [Rhizopus arrhizus]|nr:hypothetical protein G6F35_017056 [Rhizopus arrhizus]